VADRDRVLAHAFVRLADTLADDFDLVEFLQGLSSEAIRVLEAQAAGVMLVDGVGRLRVIASSEERMRLLELFELQNAQGPCLDAFRTGATLAADAREGRERWPDFAAAAADEGFLSFCAIPLRLRADVLGALNVFRSTDAAFTEIDLEIGQAMAQVAATGLVQQRALAERSLLADQLQYALHSRVVIEQAKGMLAEHHKISVDEAFAALRDHARRTNRKLTQLARDVAERNLALDGLGSVRPEVRTPIEPGLNRRRTAPRPG
jgi:GAF domain-containing protein